MTGQQITSFTAAVGECLFWTSQARATSGGMSRSKGFTMPLDEKQKFISLNFKLFGIYWRIGLGEQKPCRLTSSTPVLPKLTSCLFSFCITGSKKKKEQVFVLIKL